ncbi:MAG: thiolase family protein [Kineosporiaceae bacterium]
MTARPVVVAAARTPVATSGRALAAVGPAALASPVLDRLAADLRRAGLPDEVDDVLLGNCCGPGGDVARIAVLGSGLGVEVAGVTVDRQCGSGLEALRLGAALVASGQARVVLAGGSESASTSTRAFPRAAFAPPGVPDPDMGVAADALARARGITRERQDAYAARSHALAVRAASDGRYAPELVTVAGLGADDRPRPGLDAARLARFRPAFAPDGTVTAGNSCGINDGAAAVALVGARDAAGVPGLAVTAAAAVGVDPALPGLGAAAAVRAVCARAGVDVADVGALEITEAFAAQVLACTDELGLDPFASDVVCGQGGAIALGHPWGASGALLVVRLFARMVRDGGGPRWGVAACAVGGGQGVAVLVERVG